MSVALHGYKLHFLVMRRFLDQGIVDLQCLSIQQSDSVTHTHTHTHIYMFSIYLSIVLQLITLFLGFPGSSLLRGGLSLAVAGGLFSSWQCTGFSHQQLLLLPRTGSRACVLR